MSTITDSLKNFYKKLGGSLSNLGPNSTSADIVDAMAEVYTDKEGTYVEVTEEVTEGTKIATIKTNNVDHDIYAPVGLPTVTSSDEGKVLSVDSNGDWAAAIPAGCDVLVINATYSGSTVTFEKTIPQIKNLIASSSKPVVLYVTRTGYSNRRVFILGEIDGYGSCYFYKVSVSTTGNRMVSVIELGRDATGSMATITSYNVLIPPATSSDNGKILTVVDGEPVWITETPELPAVTSADGGKVLSVDSNGVWVPAELSNGIPAFTSADAGKVLTVNSSGELEWVTPT